MVRPKNLRSWQNGMRYITGLRFGFLVAGEMCGTIRNTSYCCSENDRKWCVALQKPAWKSLHSIVKANSHISCRKHNATPVWNLYGIVPMRMETADYTECELILKLKASLSSVFMLHLHCVSFLIVCGKQLKNVFSSSSSCSLNVRRFFLFLNPQSGAGPSISSLAVPRSFFLPVCISVPVLAPYLCPSSLRVVATFSGTVVFPCHIDCRSASSFWRIFRVVFAVLWIGYRPVAGWVSGGAATLIPLDLHAFL
jgi:hypothetical protein